MNSYPKDNSSDLAQCAQSASDTVLPERLKEQLIKILISQAAVNKNWQSTWSQVMKNNNITVAEVEARLLAPQINTNKKPAEELVQAVNEAVITPQEIAETNVVESYEQAEEDNQYSLQYSEPEPDHKETPLLCAFCNRPFKAGSIYCKCGTDVSRLSPSDATPPPTCSPKPKTSTPPLPKAAEQNMVNKLKSASNNNARLDQNPKYSSLFMNKEKELL